MRKAATVTGFILLGMFLLIAFAGSWYLLEKIGSSGPDRLSPQGAAAGCMTLASQSSLQKLGRQTIIPLIGPSEEYNVSLSSRQKNLLPPINQIETSLQPVFSRHFIECLQQSSYDQGFRVNSSRIEPQVFITFSPNELIAKMTYSVELQRGSEVLTLQPLTLTQPSRYRQVHQAMSGLIDFYVDEGYLALDDLTLIPDIFFKQTAMDDGFALFITDGSYKASQPINYTFILR